MPSTVSIEGKVISLIQYSLPDTPYIVLETMTKDRDQSKVIHILSYLDQARFKVGRGHECDVRFQDISISRYHSSIKFQKGEWYIADNRSKFGTVV
jgi:pSer/pThr/pTyr-binding forkhead associated (FHA) protein